MKKKKRFIRFFPAINVSICSDVYIYTQAIDLSLYIYEPAKKKKSSSGTDVTIVGISIGIY